MKRTLLTFVITLMFLVCLSTPQAKAETILGDYLKELGIDLDVDISASVDWYNKYVWRGFLLDGDPVIQPSVTMSIGDIFGGTLEGGIWGSWDVSNDDSLAGDEIDGWIGYSFDLGFIEEDYSIVGFNFGHTWYGFPEGNTGLADGSHSEEFYAGLTVDTFLSPYVTWYIDYADESSGGANGYYVMFGGSHSFELSEKYGITADLGLEYGLNKRAFISEDGGYILTTLGINLPLTEIATMTPSISYSAPFDDIDTGNNEELYFGVSMAFSM